MFDQYRQNESQLTIEKSNKRYLTLINCTNQVQCKQLNLEIRNGLDFRVLNNHIPYCGKPSKKKNKGRHHLTNVTIYFNSWGGHFRNPNFYMPLIWNI